MYSHIITAIDNNDDFSLGEFARFAYVVRHRGNMLDRVSLAPGHGGEVRHLAGDPLNEEPLALSSVAWGRRQTDPGQVAYVTIDGGSLNPRPLWAKNGASMPDTTTSLGGRLPLAHRSALSGAKLELFDRLITEAVPWAQRAGFVMESADGALVGPFNPLLESPEISATFWDWQVSEEKYTTLSGRERQVVILAVGAVWRAPYELYAHSTAARTAGLSPQQVETLAGGGMADQLSTREQCAWSFTRQLTAERRIEQSLYDEAAELFGTHGISDMLLLIGAYQTVCGLLNAFDILAPEAP